MLKCGTNLIKTSLWKKLPNLCSLNLFLKRNLSYSSLSWNSDHSNATWEHHRSEVTLNSPGYSLSSYHPCHDGGHHDIKAKKAAKILKKKRNIERKRRKIETLAEECSTWRSARWIAHTALVDDHSGQSSLKRWYNIPLLMVVLQRDVAALQMFEYIHFKAAFMGWFTGNQHQCSSQVCHRWAPHLHRCTGPLTRERGAVPLNTPPARLLLSPGKWVSF